MKNDAGLHIMFDGYVKDESVFNNAALTDIFKKMAGALDMQIIMGPSFLTVELDPKKLTSDVFQDEGGITGMCVISTSHMSIHCWPLRKCFSLDVFSCKPFDDEKAKDILWDALGIVSGNCVTVKREFPRIV